MKIGSLVKCVVSFEELRNIWGFDYPYRGDILTVSKITRHPNIDCRRAGIICLHFSEKPMLIEVCDKQIDGVLNFIEVLPPIDLEEELKQKEYDTILD